MSCRRLMCLGFVKAFGIMSGIAESCTADGKKTILLREERVHMDLSPSWKARHGTGMPPSLAWRFMADEETESSSEATILSKVLPLVAYLSN